MDANLALVAQLNGARKLVLGQVREAEPAIAGGAHLRGTAAQLTAIVRLVRALPPIPEPTAAREFAASLDAFEAALLELLRAADRRSTTGDAAKRMERVTDLIAQSVGHYQTATDALRGALV